MLERTPRVVAADVGTKRVGLAMADPLRLFSQPLGTYRPDEAVAELERLHAADGIDTLVVGWPLTPEGDEATATRLVQPFINRVRKRLRGVVVVKQDERYTSETAKARLRESGQGRRMARDRGLVDAAAAAVILQDYLDGI